MRKRWNFLRRATASGYDWLVEVSNHLGAWALILAVFGVSVFSGWKLPHWWLGLLVIGGAYVVLLGEGAYRVWREAESSLIVIRQELAAESESESLVTALRRLQAEARILAAECRAADAFDPSAQYDYNEFVGRVSRKLRLGTPEHLEYWRQNAPDPGQPSGRSEMFAAQLDWSVKQIDHICSEIEA